MPKPLALREQRMEETSVTATPRSHLSSPLLLQGCNALIAGWSVAEHPRSSMHPGGATVSPAALGMGTSPRWGPRAGSRKPPHAGSCWHGRLHEQEQELGLTAGACGDRRGPGRCGVPVAPGSSLRAVTQIERSQETG